MRSDPVVGGDALDRSGASPAMWSASSDAGIMPHDAFRVRQGFFRGRGATDGAQTV